MPLPVSAQFLNVIESVFSGLARAIIHNSDYQSVDECKEAIDGYFSERNKAFADHPRRAGNKIWGNERVEAIFKEENNCKDPTVRNYPGGWAARLARGGAFGTCPALARHALGWFSAVMERADLERLSKDELIELVLRLQRPQKTSRTSSKPPSTDRKERREQARPGGAKPG